MGPEDPTMNRSEPVVIRNAQLFTGVTLDFAYDAESGAFSEDEILAWGTEIPYTPLAQAAQVCGGIP